MIGKAVKCCLRLCLVCISLIYTSEQSYAKPTEPPPSIIRNNCAVFFPEAVIVNTNTIRIPFRWLGRLPVVQAGIDTLSGNFVFDTGAERLLLNRQYFSGGKKIYNKDQYGVTGKQNEVYAKKVDSLIWENLLITNLNAHILDLSHIEEKRNAKIVGVLGYEVFMDYEILLDYPFKQIVLTKVDAMGNRLDKEVFKETPFDTLDFKMARHGIVLEANVGNQRLWMNLDTGAEINMIDRKVNRRVLKNFKILKRVQLSGAGNKEVEVLAGTLAYIQCGKQKNGAMRTLLTNLDEISRIFDTRIDGVLGFEFLRPRRTIINYPKKQLYFLPLVRP